MANNTGNRRGDPRYINFYTNYKEEKLVVPNVDEAEKEAGERRRRIEAILEKRRQQAEEVF